MAFSTIGCKFLYSLLSKIYFFWSVTISCFVIRTAIFSKRFCIVSNFLTYYKNIKFKRKQDYIKNIIFVSKFIFALSEMKIICLIPARYDSTRFPAKLMKDLGGKSVIRRCYENALSMCLFDEVYVVTDSIIISKEIKQYGGKVIISKEKHISGSDRIAEAVKNIDTDIVINIQGDEPFVTSSSIRDLIDVFVNDNKKEIDLVSLMTYFKTKKEVKNPNNVKVIVDKNNFAIYFSRAVIPYIVGNKKISQYYKHKGVYAFRKESLLYFHLQEVSALESLEKIECIRYLEHRKKIKMVYTPFQGIGIDTPEDLEEARNFLKNN